MTIQSRGNDSIDTIFFFGSTRTSISVSERPRVSPGSRRSCPISRKMAGRFETGTFGENSASRDWALLSSFERAFVIVSTASRTYR